MCSMNTRKSIFFSQSSVRIQLYKQLGYNTYLKLLRLPLLGGQPSRLTNSFVEYYRFDSLMSQLFKLLEYHMYLKLLRLPLSATNLVDLLSRSSNIIDSTLSCCNSTSNLDTNVSKVIMVTAICNQPCRLTNSLIG